MTDAVSAKIEVVEAGFVGGMPVRSAESAGASAVETAVVGDRGGPSLPSPRAAVGRRCESSETKSTSSWSSTNVSTALTV